MNREITASIIGGTGYTGGELIRLLDGHRNVHLMDITSRSQDGRSISKIHPHLRHMNLKFSSTDELGHSDVLFLATPHGISQDNIDDYRSHAEVIIDLSSDFRLTSADTYEKWYTKHKSPQYLSEFVYGLVELHRKQLKSARLISSAGCNATASILGLFPLVDDGLIKDDELIIVDMKVGSSEGGRAFNLSTHHPERVGTVRSYQPTGHRHTAEVIQELGLTNIYMSATSIELVRGALATIHISRHIPLKKMWKTYRRYYGNEPFIRLINERTGHYRLPDPKLLAGTNYCDIGFRPDSQGERTVIISAIDNLMKGAAGQAVQAMNLRFGCDETEALEFSGLHP